MTRPRAGENACMALVVLLSAAACAQGNPGTKVSGNRAVEEPSTVSTDSAHAQEAGTVRSTRAQQPSAAALVGSWLLASDPPQPMPGLRITITVDSVQGPRFFGSLTHFFSGNVGIDPKGFEPFADSLREDSTLLFMMPAVDRESSGIAMRGRLATDTIRLSTFVLGRDSLANGSRRWLLIKQRTP